MLQARRADPYRPFPLHAARRLAMHVIGKEERSWHQRCRTSAPLRVRRAIAAEIEEIGKLQPQRSGGGEQSHQGSDIYHEHADS